MKLVTNYRAPFADLQQPRRRLKAIFIGETIIATLRCIIPQSWPQLTRKALAAGQNPVINHRPWHISRAAHGNMCQRTRSRIHCEQVRKHGRTHRYIGTHKTRTSPRVPLERVYSACFCHGVVNRHMLRVRLITRYYASRNVASPFGFPLAGSSGERCRRSTECVPRAPTFPSLVS